MNAVATPIALSPDDVAKLCADNLRMRDKLLELAKDCAECGGTGCVTVGFGERVDPCPDCEDIRELLA